MAIYPLGLKQGKVLLSDPDPSWSSLFEAEAERISVALGPVVLAIEHYGSTSVPALKAKPILDLLVGLRRLDDALELIEPMATLGYDFAPHAGVPGHHVFGRGAARTHLAHFVEHGGESWRACLAFRDRLRSDPDARKGYEQLKAELAERFADDRAAYTAGKTDFVRRLLAGT